MQTLLFLYLTFLANYYLEFNKKEQIPAAILDTHTFKAGFQIMKTGFERILAGDKMK